MSYLGRARHLSLETPIQRSRKLVRCSRGSRRGAPFGRPEERDDAFAEWRRLGSGAPASGMGFDHPGLEGAVQRIGHEPGFPVGYAHELAGAEDRAASLDRLNERDVGLVQAAPIGKA